MKFTRRQLIVALICLSLLRFGLSGSLVYAQQSVELSTPPSLVAETSEIAKRQEAFDIVWTTIKRVHYDPTFGGVDWDKVRERYAPQVALAQNNSQFYLILQTMINELHQSHFLIIPPEAIPNYPDANDAEELLNEDEVGGEVENEGAMAALKRAKSKLTAQLTSGIGIDLRIQNGSAMITSVEPGSTAARAGLRPGYVIKRANGISLDLIIDRTLKNPIWKRVIRPEMHQVLLAGYINGESRTIVRLQVLDGRNRLRRVNVMREALKGVMSPPIGNLPSVFTEFETRRLEKGIGYIRFTAFVPMIMEKLCGAIRTMHDAPGLIIDLRGNQGGVIGMIGGLVGLLNSQQTYLGSLTMRGGRTDLYSFPQSSPYTGAIVLLIDGSTQSAAEMFASAFQSQDRAVIVGERSAGNTVPSDIKELPTGALFQYGFASFHTQTGLTLEGSGLPPDVNVTLSRKELLAGRDAQLVEAIAQVKFRIDAIALAKLAQMRPNPSEAIVVGGPVSSAKMLGDPKTKSESPVPPPPPVKRDSSVKLPEAAATSKASENFPSVDQILEKYLAARGGRAALEKLSSRVTKGKAEFSSMNLSGTIEINEKAPNKSITTINVPGLGLFEEGFDGTKGWTQDSLRGHIRASGLSTAVLRRRATFHKELTFKETYGTLTVRGKEKIGQREAYVVQERIDNIEVGKFYFDVDTGLLLRSNNTFFEDFREVDGIMLPYVIREDDESGFGYTFRVTEINHNVAIDDTTFVAHPSCFTQITNSK